MDGATSLDLKIARDKLLENVEPLWDEVCAACESACRKLKEAYGYVLDLPKINDHNSAIRITHTVVSADPYGSIDKTLEIRVDRSEKKIVARIDTKHARSNAPQSGEPRVYKIVADGKIASLVLRQHGTDKSGIDFAEHEIAEELLKLKLAD